MPSDRKHFLDSSVARPMLLGTNAYRQYFADQFGNDPCYTSSYVQMEIRRSYLCNILNFFFVLNLPTIQTYGDALKLWSNKFKGSEVKAVEQLAGELADSQRIDRNKPRDKQAAIRALGAYIKRLDVKLRNKYRNVGTDSARCARAAVSLQASSSHLEEGFREFLEAFGDTDDCRSRCRIDKFLLERFRKRVDAYIDAAGAMPKNKKTRGFIGVADNLKEIVDGGPDACSCKRCEAIGDAVIALDAPRDMRLEHTDHSFNQLCPPIKQQHYQHPSENAVVVKGAAAPEAEEENEDHPDAP